MQETSSLYKRIVTSPNHWFETRVVIGEAGNLITEGGEQILFGGDAIVVSRVGPESGYEESVVFSVQTSIDMFDTGPSIGKAVAGEIDLKMINPSGDMPRMSVVVPYVRAIASLADGDDVTIEDGVLEDPSAMVYGNGYLQFSASANVINGIVVFTVGEHETMSSEWIQQGTYYIDTREISNNDDGLVTLTIHGFDVMLFAEQNYASTELVWPAIDTDVVSEIASKMGVPVDPRTWEIMTDGYTFELPTAYTLREMLGFIAGAYAGCFVMTDSGELRLVSMAELPAETRYLVDESGYSIVFGDTRILV